MVQAASAKNLVGTGLGFPTCFPLEVFWGASGEVSKISVPGKSQTLCARNGGVQVDGWGKGAKARVKQLQSS